MYGIVTYRLLCRRLTCGFKNVHSMKAGELKRLIGTAIRSKRSELGISQEELADRAGLHRTYISDVERGARNPSLESIHKLAMALELSLSGLFDHANVEDLPKPAVEILLVEDDPADVVLTLRAFRKARFNNTVHVVRDGVAALDFIFANDSHSTWGGESQPGVILLDLRLPKLSGLEVLRQIKADRRTSSIPVIILTASCNDDEVAECMRLGVVNYIPKPVDFQNFSGITPQLHFEWALVKPR